VDLLCHRNVGQKPNQTAFGVHAGRRLGAGLWQQQLPLSVCGMRGISIAALQPSDK
jgi:hypothetical protein